MMTGMLHPMSKKTGSSKSSLFLGDIDLSLDEAGLASLCAPFGSVLMAKVQRSKLTYKSLGYGFVTMSTPEEALRCIEKLDGVMAGDRAMRVSWAERNRVLLVCNLNPTTTLEKVVMYFENYGSIERDACVEGMKDSVRYVVISFTKRANAERCRASLNGTMIDGFPISICWYQPSLLDRLLAPKSSSTTTFESNRGYISNTLWRVHNEGDTDQSTASSISPRGVNSISCTLSDEETANAREIEPSSSSLAAPSSEPSIHEKKLGGLGSATSIYVKFESFVKSIAINEAVFHDIFSQFGAITEVTLKKLLIDQITGRRHGYAFVHFTSDDVGRAAAIAAVQATQLGITAFGINITTEISKTLHRQMQQRFILPPYIGMAEYSPISPTLTSFSTITYPLNIQPNYVAHSFPRNRGAHPPFIVAYPPSSGGVSQMPVYGVLPPTYGYFDAQR